MAKEEISPELYKKFIDSLNLNAIQITEYSAKAEEDFSPPAEIAIEHEPKYVKIDENNFKVYHRYVLTTVQEGKETPGFYLSATYLVVYSSKIPITDAIFGIFSKLNLSLHTWPYFRELVHSTTLRMNLSPLVLDILKIGGKTQKQENQTGQKMDSEKI